MPTNTFPCAVVLFAVTLANAAEPKFTIHNAEGLKTNVVIQGTSNHELPQVGTLIDEKGNKFTFEADQSKTFRFIVPILPSGITVYSFQPQSPANGNEATPRATESNQKVTFNAGHSPLLVYQGRETELPRPDIKPLFKRGGYLHPVYSPSGRVVTDDYPPNHIHHHGIWMPWTKTEFEGRSPDFWNMGDGKGKVEFVELKGIWSGPVSARITAQHRFLDLTSGQAKPALNETWTVVSYGVLPGEIPANVFDLESVQTTATDSPLKLPKYYYGGLGFRGNWAWNGAEKTFFMSSDGRTNRLEGNEERANWCYIGGELEEQQSGVAILSHPSNFRSPQPMRWHPSEPFFCFAPSQLGDWEIKPGEPYISRYRFVVFDGKPNREWIEQQYQNYANPPKVRIEF